MGSRTNGLAQPCTAGLLFGFALRSSARRLAALSGRLWAAYWDYQLRRATVRLLQTLDDRMLQDIGLTRSETGAAAFRKEH